MVLCYFRTSHTCNSTFSSQHVVGRKSHKYTYRASRSPTISGNISSPDRSRLSRNSIDISSGASGPATDFPSLFSNDPTKSHGELIINDERARRFLPHVGRPISHLPGNNSDRLATIIPNDSRMKMADLRAIAVSNRCIESPSSRFREEATIEEAS